MDYFNCECCDTRIHFEDAYDFYSDNDGTTTFFLEARGNLYTADNDSICQDCGEKHNSGAINRLNQAYWKACLILDL